LDRQPCGGEYLCSQHWSSHLERTRLPALCSPCRRWSSDGHPKIVSQLQSHPSFFLPSSPLSVSWRYSPFYLLQRTFSLFISNLRKLNPHKSKPTIRPFDLVASGDELRSEMAPFTGDYFQFLRSELLAKTALRCIAKLVRKLR
jgi:hypothetical protein